MKSGYLVIKILFYKLWPEILQVDQNIKSLMVSQILLACLNFIMNFLINLMILNRVAFIILISVQLLFILMLCLCFVLFSLCNNCYHHIFLQLMHLSKNNSSHNFRIICASWQFKKNYLEISISGNCSFVYITAGYHNDFCSTIFWHCKCLVKKHVFEGCIVTMHVLTEADMVFN